MALQAILESDFFNAVREVYEHVHETVDIQGDPEVRANATAKVSYQGLMSQTNQHLSAQIPLSKTKMAIYSIL